MKKSLNLGLRREFQCDFIIADVPLAILGADFLARHGLLPDCRNQRIIDSLTGLSAKGSLRFAPIHSVSTLETAAEGTVAQQYIRLTEEFSDLFEPSSGPVQIKSLPVKHSIITTGPPISERPRRLIGDRLAAAKKVFDDLLSQEDIEANNNNNNKSETSPILEESHDTTNKVSIISLPSQLTPSLIAEAQANDGELKQMPQDNSLDLQCIVLNGFDVWCDVAHGNVRPYLPERLRRQTYEVQHNLSHPGIKATVRAVAGKYVWPGMRKQVSAWAKCCTACQTSKISRHNRSKLGRFTEPDSRFAHIHIDLIKLPKVDNKQYCLTIIDRFSRWPIAIPLPNMVASTVAQALLEWISSYGAPDFITSDRGGQFESDLFQELAKLFGIQHVRTCSYHPISNGLIERFHRTLKAALKCATQPWTEALPMVMLGLRTDDLQASPVEMVYGTTLSLPGDFCAPSTPITEESTFVRKLRHLFREIKPVPTSRHSSKKPFVFKDLASCTHVFRRIDRLRKPLEPPHSEPHRIIKRIDDRTFNLDIDGDAQVVSTDQPPSSTPIALVDAAPAEARQPRACSTTTSSRRTPTPPAGTTNDAAEETNTDTLTKLNKMDYVNDILGCGIDENKLFSFTADVIAGLLTEFSEHDKNYVVEKFNIELGIRSNINETAMEHENNVSSDEELFESPPRKVARRIDHNPVLKKNRIYFLLRETLMGEIILGQYRKSNVINRSKLARIVLLEEFKDRVKHVITNYGLEKNEFIKFREEIVDLFPNEDPCLVYESSVSSNIKSQSQSSKGYLYSVYKKLNSSNSVYKKRFNLLCFTQELKDIHESLFDPNRENHPDPLSVADDWRKTFKERNDLLYEIVKKEYTLEVKDYLNNLKCITPPNGIHLIESDFMTIIKNGSPKVIKSEDVESYKTKFFVTWPEQFLPVISKLAEEAAVKQKLANAKKAVKPANAKQIDENSTYDITEILDKLKDKALYLLPHLIRNNKRIDVGGTLKTISKEEKIKLFFPITQDKDGLPKIKQEILDLHKKYSLDIISYVVYCGSSYDQIEKAFVILKDQDYKYKKHNVLYQELYGSLQPKFPHLTHYPRLLEKFGPCENFNTSRYESRHRHIKANAVSTSSWKDLPYTVAVKQVLGMVYLKNNFDLKTETEFGPLIGECNEDSQYFEYVNIEGLLYEPEMIFVTNISDELEFGEEGFIPDYLHMALEGVAKQFTNYVVHNLYEMDIERLDDKMLSVAVPQQISRRTRKISDRKDWKAREWA
ncbi:hypothetical protein TKK_0007577 [Trichogramma kaykai]